MNFSKIIHLITAHEISTTMDLNQVAELIDDLEEIMKQKIIEREENDRRDKDRRAMKMAVIEDNRKRERRTGERRTSNLIVNLI